jgi:hypothetical protein
MLEQQITEIDCEAHTFLLKLCLDVLVDGELCSKTHRVIVKNSKSRRAEKDLVCSGVGHGDIRLKKRARAFADQFCEESPIPFVRCSSPLRRAVSVDEAVVEDIRPLAAVVLEELCHCPAKPDVVTQ